MKTIVTHLSPDFDAVVGCWLIKKFLPGWQNALIKFVPAGETLNNQQPDINPDIIHIDTGLGKFDHHQTDEFTCAAQLVFDFLKKKKIIKKKDLEPLERFIDLVNQIDHFQEAFFYQADADIYDLTLYQIIEGLKNSQDDNQIMKITFPLLDAVFLILKNKVKAEKEIKKGLTLKIKWGKCIILETENEEAIKLALKKGYCLVIRRNPYKGYIRIKTLPEKKYDLTPLYQELKKNDPTASWFLHVSKNMLLNGSSKNPNLKPTKLSLSQIIKIIKKFFL